MNKITQKSIISIIPSSAKFFNSHKINYFNIHQIKNLLKYESEKNNVRIDLKIYNFNCDYHLVNSCCYWNVRHQLLIDKCLERNKKDNLVLRNGGNIVELGYFWNDFYSGWKRNPRNRFRNLTFIRKQEGQKEADRIQKRFKKTSHYFRKAHKGKASEYLLKTLNILEQLGKINKEKDVFCLMTKDENPNYNENITGLRKFYESLGLIEYEMYEKHNGSKNWYYYCDYKDFKNKLEMRVNKYEKIKKERRKANKLKKQNAKQIKYEKNVKKAEQKRIVEKNNFKWKIIEAYENTIREIESDDEEPESVSGANFYAEDKMEKYLSDMIDLELEKNVENEIVSKNKFNFSNEVFDI